MTDSYEDRLLNRRTVRPHLDLAAGEEALKERDRVVLWDLHGLYWTVPVELTILEANEQIIAVLHSHSLAEFPDTTVRPHRACWPTDGDFYNVVEYKNGQPL